PDANNDSATTNEDSAVVINVLANDTDGNGDALTITKVNGQNIAVGGSVAVTGGTVTLGADGKLTFTPTADFNGSTSCTYYVADGGLTDTATVNVTVNAVADIVGDSATTNEDTSVTTNVLANDSFEGSPSVTAVTQGAHGTVVNNGDGTVTYTPNADYNGTDSYTYTVTSGGVSETATVNVTVNAVKDAPSGSDNTRQVLEDGSHTFAAGDFGFTDAADGNSLQSVIITTLPANGTLKLNGVAVSAGQEIPAGQLGLLVFAPAADANGAGYASFTFQVRDNGGTLNGGGDTEQSPNTITIDVTRRKEVPSGAE